MKGKAWFSVGNVIVRALLVVSSALVLLTILILFQQSEQVRFDIKDRHNRSIKDCAYQLSHIYGDLKRYATKHGGRFPRQLSDLVLEGYENDPEWFQCPGSAYLPIVGKTPAEVAASMNRAGATSYQYYGSNLNDHSQPNSILMAEYPQNHQGAGGHVVYLDGRIEFLKADDANAVIFTHNLTEEKASGATSSHVK